MLESKTFEEKKPHTNQHMQLGVDRAQGLYRNNGCEKRKEVDGSINAASKRVEKHEDKHRFHAH